MATTDVSPSPPVLKIRALYDQRSPMRDGVELSADVYMPAEDGPVPALLIRTPYDNISEEDVRTRSAMVDLAQRGYAVVAQDVRGRFDSEGDWYPFINEAEDGHDTIEWIAKQPWCNGKVATFGGSYRGLPSGRPRKAAAHIWRRPYRGSATQISTTTGSIQVAPSSWPSDSPGPLRFTGVACSGSTSGSLTRSVSAPFTDICP